MGDIAVILFKDKDIQDDDVHGPFMVFEFLKHSWKSAPQEATVGLRLERIIVNRITKKMDLKNYTGKNFCKIKAGKSALVKNKNDKNCSYIIDFRSRVI